MPILDPAYKDVLTFENGNSDFPHGPMYWIHGKDGKEMEALAVGTTEEKERREKVCVVKKLLGDDEDPVGGQLMNGHAKGADTLGEDLHTVPTAAPSVANTEAETNANITVTAPAAPEPAKTTEGLTPVVVQEGELVPASRPEPVKFVTATEELNTLSLNEKVENIPNGTVHVGESKAVSTDTEISTLVAPTKKLQSNGNLPKRRGL